MKHAFRLPAPTSRLSLPANHVHVWRAVIDVSEAAREELEEVLSTDERERATRYPFTRDRRRFVAARGILRHILARYASLDPADLVFVYNDCGKPALPSGCNRDDRAEGIRFNLSHSEGLALYAVSLEREVGIDLEHAETAGDCTEVAERFLSAREFRMLLELPEGVRSQAFLAGWTRKEAYLKARGIGLSAGLDGLDLLGGRETASGLGPVSFEPSSGWTVRDIPIDAGFAAALAVEGSEFAVSFWQWSAAQLPMETVASLQARNGL